ncbi:helix-turn-helix domain-containing protein [Shewanella sp. 4t3-1-2LB]|uniref:GlxA family transcriptional regulator n=1 Tax=Shewanella sp. 4t3-1-2LB TaxID=2817682 RepID=UPI001A99CA1E|nr:helix-turn-helix domain-containing protein [Shewanella sp. 4t3-1-2LB]MBO1272708.1 helix-turn-helix domain-containing protein [Shewanella sp. 4t3-1-2LB]
MSAVICRQSDRHRLAILAVDEVVLFDLAIPQQMFPMARSSEGTALYEVFFCGPKPIARSGAVTINEVAPLSELFDADTVIIPGNLQMLEFHQPQVIEALQHAAAQGIRLASICTGAAILAATGLLNGLRATTHWMLVDKLAQCYPAIRVESDVLFVDNGQLLTSAGLAAGQDLCLHMISHDFGVQVAEKVADMLVMPLARQGSQAQQLYRHNEHAASPLQDLQLWMLDQLHQPLTLKTLAQRACISQRSLSRRFHEQTGISPMAWLYGARVRRAQSLLESSRMSVEQIAAACGFGSAAGLREAFRREVGSSPSAWRKTYSTLAATDS